MDKRTRRKFAGRALTIAVLGGTAALIAYGFVPKPIPVTVRRVERRSLEVTVDETGKTRIRDKYIVSAPVSGSLSRIALEAGDPVAEGDHLAEIAPLAPQLLDARSRHEAEAQVEVARANLERTHSAIARADSAYDFAKSQAERSRQLRRQGGLSEQQLEEAEYQLRAAADELASARLAARVSANELNASRAALSSINAKDGRKIAIVAPVAGRVLRVLQQSAGAVQAGAPLLELGDPSALEVVADVLSTDAVRIVRGASARIEGWGGSYPLHARVRRKQPSAFTTRSALGVEEQRVPVILDFVDEPARWAALDDGYRVEARIRVAKVDDALVVPASALFRGAAGWAAFKVVGDQAQRVQVELGLRNPDWAEVKRGLEERDRVIVYPSDRVAQGVEVSARDAEASKS